MGGGPPNTTVQKLPLLAQPKVCRDQRLNSPSDPWVGTRDHIVTETFRTFISCAARLLQQQQNSALFPVPMTTTLWYRSAVARGNESEGRSRNDRNHVILRACLQRNTGWKRKRDTQLAPPASSAAMMLNDMRAIQSLGPVTGCEPHAAGLLSRLLGPAADSAPKLPEHC